MILQELIGFLEQLAPSSLQEPYDNSGLLIGRKDKEVSKALISLDLTEEVLQEAIGKKCEVVISHHPLIFSGLKRLNGKSSTERLVEEAIRKDIAVYAIHTNLDNVEAGVNQRICGQLGLQDTKILDPKKGLIINLTTFVPNTKLDDGRYAPDVVRGALWKAGAGNIGDYNNCSFNLEGKGSFRALPGAEPFIGEENELVFQDETRISVIFPDFVKSDVLKALRSAHPYDEVAYDLFKLENEHKGIGAGMIGMLENEMDEKDFLNFLKARMQTACIRYSPLTGRKIKSVAVCGGSGSFLLKTAIARSADAFVTADFKYHQFFDAEGRILIADIGHYESEQFTINLLYDEISRKFPNFAVLKTAIITNPVNYI